MSKTKILFSGLFLAIFMAGNAYSGNIGDVSVLSIPLEQNPADQYQLAKSTFLPETYDDLGLSGRHNTKYDFNKNDCSAYPLSSCPSNGKCTRCPVGAGWKLNSCNSGYTKSGNTCTKDAVFCETNATTFLNNIPADYTCDKVKTSTNCTAGKPCDRCYSSCHKINCSGYSLDCNTINKTALHIATTEICPTCRLSNSNCAKPYCKITACADGYKINAAGTACVEKEDICPNDYYESCETGTQGDPKYTEKGTACYQCKPKTEDKPQRECESPGYVCIYSDGNNNICIGPECSEKEYPNVKDYMLPSCTIAPTYGQWCSKRSCSDDNVLCYDLLGCSEHITPQCKTMFAWNQVTNTCSHSDELGYPSSCKITGDYSAYECPAGQKCLFTFDDSYYYTGRCVDASITEADIQKAIIDITSHACSFDNINADSKKVLFYLGSDNNLSELLKSLDRLKASDSNYISGQAYSGWSNNFTACSQSSYNVCMKKTYTSVNGVPTQDIVLKSCHYPSFFNPHSKQYVQIACEQRNSTYITTFCKMDYCAIDLEKMNEYSLSDRTKEILNTYVLHDLKQSLLSSSDEYYNAAIYNIHADYKTVSHDISSPQKNIGLSYYLTGCGACNKHIEAIGVTTTTSADNKNIYGAFGCFDIGGIDYADNPCSSAKNEYSFIYRMLYNPDTITNYDGTATEADCQSTIKNDGNGYCFLENNRIY